MLFLPLTLFTVGHANRDCLLSMPVAFRFYIYFSFQTEAPLIVKPFIADMTLSELHAVMTGGFATIAGSLLGLYTSYGVNNHFDSVYS